MTIEHLAYRIAHGFVGGIGGLAELMARGRQVLTNKLNPNCDTHRLTVDEFEMLADFANQNVIVAQHFARKCNAVVVGLPPEDEVVGDMSLLEAFMRASIAAGDFAQEFQKALEDNRITPLEMEKMRQKMHAHIALQLGVLAKLEAVVE